MKGRYRNLEITLRQEQNRHTVTLQHPLSRAQEAVILHSSSNFQSQIDDQLPGEKMKPVPTLYVCTSYVPSTSTVHVYLYRYCTGVNV